MAPAVPLWKVRPSPWPLPAPGQVLLGHSIAGAWCTLSLGFQYLPRMPAALGASQKGSRAHRRAQGGWATRSRPSVGLRESLRTGQRKGTQVICAGLQRRCKGQGSKEEGEAGPGPLGVEDQEAGRVCVAVCGHVCVSLVCTCSWTGWKGSEGRSSPWAHGPRHGAWQRVLTPASSVLLQRREQQSWRAGPGAPRAVGRWLHTTPGSA